MSIDELKGIVAQLKKATCPEDVFGLLKDLPALKVLWRRLAKVTHEDHYSDPYKAMAKEAFQELQKRYEEAQKKFKSKTYGDRKPVMPAVVIRSKVGAYTLGDLLAFGDVCNIYTGVDARATPVVVKMTRSPKNNDLTANEYRTLTFLKSDSRVKDLKVMEHIPTILDSFELQQDKIKHRVNVFKYTKTFVTLADVIKSYPDGIDPQDAAWMWNRLLGALVGIHQASIIHGAIIPPHILIDSSSHNGMLIGWSYAVKTGECVKAMSSSNVAFYPQEILNKKPVSPATDLYMAALCMVRLLGGIVKLNAIPTTVPRAIVGLIRACLFTNPKQRISDAYELFEDFNKVLVKLYGQRKFRKFTMP